MISCTGCMSNGDFCALFYVCVRACFLSPPRVVRAFVILALRLGVESKTKQTEESQGTIFSALQTHFTLHFASQPTSLIRTHLIPLCSALFIFRQSANPTLLFFIFVAFSASHVSLASLTLCSRVPDFIAYIFRSLPFFPLFFFSTTPAPTPHSHPFILLFALQMVDMDDAQRQHLVQSAFHALDYNKDGSINARDLLLVYADTFPTPEPGHAVLDEVIPLPIHSSFFLGAEF